MRLTTELIQESLSYLNPLKERELNLRGQRIPAIENLGVAGPHDAIDFTDNDIQVLGNIPLSPRLQTLLLAHNRIAGIQAGLHKAMPNLKNLVLAYNDIAELADLDVLAKFPRLTHLHYRYWILWRCPSLRFLDYEKVKEAERGRARELFGTAEEPTPLAIQIMGKKGRSSFETVTAGSAAAAASSSSKLSRIKLTTKEKARLQDRIKKATSLQEIIALERELNEGRLPSGIQADGMEE
ncbi:hypothetical protein DCS_00732 [Drechmeria coniospora]|uniref:U2 small nuclear ribonucleoprotein A' n=1 Tax=Drechmeria coniospora TaxID=98403 RepID=A0A151GR83_DRECN|nr:hypothetical protein DCS_00732 [Drechmeria coniospora]KYK59600.1 hypothetical protein DCS_00732 [Drechmeria coniospora]